MLWSHVIDIVRGSLFVLAHWFGGSFGAAILAASSIVRVALLPVTFRAQLRAIERAMKLAQLAPRLDAIKKQYADDPRRAFAESSRLQKEHGLEPIDRKSLATSLVQFPPAAALYAAIRGTQGRTGAFLWIADLSRPDRLLAALAAVVSALLAWIGARAVPGTQSSAAWVPAIVGGIVSLAILTHLSSALALYSVTNSIVGGVERVVAARVFASRRDR